MHKNACAQKKSHCRGTGSEAVEKPRGKRERAEVLLRFARLFCQSFRHGLRRVTSRSLRRGLRRATVPQFNMVASLRAQSALAMFPVSLGLLRPVSATGGGLRAPLFPSGKRRLRVLTKSQKNEALIRNDGVYVISGIFSGANACVCGKKCIPAPTAGRKSSDLQAVGQIRWQTEGLSTIRESLVRDGEGFCLWKTCGLRALAPSARAQN